MNMSQIKKFENGKLIIGSTEYEATPELINELTQHLSKYGDQAAPLGGLITDLQNGLTVTYNPINNTISGLTQESSGVSEGKFRRRRAGKSQFLKNWDKTFNTDAQRFKDAVSILKTFKSGSNSSSNTSTGKGGLDASELQWIYEDDPDNAGKRRLRSTSYSNMAIKDRLQKFQDWNRDNKSVNMDKWADYIDNISNAFGLYGENLEGVFAGVIDRLDAGELTDDDKEFLRLLRITGEDSGSAAKADEAKQKQSFADLGYDYDVFKDYLTVNDGKMYLSDKGKALVSNLNADGQYGNSGNYWYNDAFVNNRNINPQGLYDFLKGHIVVGDRIYKEDDANNATSDLYKFLRQSGGFRELNSNMRINDANDLMEYMWGTKNEWNDPSSIRQFASDWMDPNTNMYYRPVTNQYDWNGKDASQQLIEYVIANPELADAFGRYNTQYQITDAFGNRGNRYNTDAYGRDLQVTATGKTDTSQYRRRARHFSSNANSKFNGRIAIGDSIDENGNTTGNLFWINPDNANDDIFYDSSKLKQYVNIPDNAVIKLPSELKKAIAAHRGEFYRAFEENPQLQDWFTRFIAGFVASDWNLSIVGGFDANLATVRPYLREFGFSDQEIEAIRNEWSKNVHAFVPMNKRRTKYLVTKPSDLRSVASGTQQTIQMEKSGGVLKMATGGTGSKGENVAASTQTLIDKPIKDSAEYTKLGSGEPLTDADKLELGALFGDAASLGLAFVPGANVASGITGMAGSTAGFVGDIKRDGFQGSDLGNYGLNLALDALAFIPGVGGAAKAGKIAKNLKKAGKVINKVMKAAAFYGIGNAAVTGWNRIQDGNWTVRDVREVVNALGGAIHLTRAGFRSPTNKKGIKTNGKVEYNEVTLKPTNEAMKEVKLTKAEVKKISEAPNSEQADKILKKFQNADPANKDATLDDIEGLIEGNIGGWNPFKRWKKVQLLDPDVAVAEVTKNGKTYKDRKTSWLNGNRESQLHWNEGMGVGEVPAAPGKQPYLTPAMAAEPGKWNGIGNAPKYVKTAGEAPVLAAEPVAPKKPVIEKPTKPVVKNPAKPTKAEKQAIAKYQRDVVEYNTKKRAANKQYKAEMAQYQADKAAWDAEKIQYDTAKAKWDALVAERNAYEANLNNWRNQKNAAKARYRKEFEQFKKDKAEIERLNQEHSEELSKWNKQKSVFDKWNNWNPQGRWRRGLWLGAPTTSGLIYSPYYEDHNGLWPATRQFGVQSPIGTISYNPSTDGYRQVQPTWNADSQVIFDKKGGILKAKGGASTKDKKEGTKSIQQSDSQTSIQGGTGYTGADGLGGDDGNIWNPNFTPALNLFGLYLANEKEQENYDILAQATPYLHQAMLSNLPRYQGSPRTNALRKSAQTLRSRYIPNTGDPVEDEMMRQALDQKATEYENQANFEESDAYNKHNVDYDTAKDTVNKQAYNISDMDGTERNKYRNALLTAKAQLNAAKSSNFDKALYAVKSDLAGKHDATNALIAYDDFKQYKDLVKRYQEETDPQKKKDLEIAIDAEKQRLEKQRLKANAYSFIAKRGGSIKSGNSTITHKKDVSGELLLQNNKNSAKMAEKTADYLFKLLLNAKPVHVS